MEESPRADAQLQVIKVRTHSITFFFLRDGIEEALTSTKVNLDQLQAGIAKTLEKIASREKYINGQLEQPLSSYKALSQQLAQTKEQYRQVAVNLGQFGRLPQGERRRGGEVPALGPVD